MALYTFFLSFREGTYISQVTASSTKQAPKEWAENLEEWSVPGLGAAGVQQIKQQIGSLAVVPIDKCKHVWSYTVIVRGNAAIVHFVQTE